MASIAIISITIIERSDSCAIPHDRIASDTARLLNDLNAGSAQESDTVGSAPDQSIDVDDNFGDSDRS